MRILHDGTKVVWEPLAGSQTLALTCPANIVVFHGIVALEKVSQSGSLSIRQLVKCPSGRLKKVILSAAQLDLLVLLLVYIQKDNDKHTKLNFLMVQLLGATISIFGICMLVEDFLLVRTRTLQ